MKNGHGHSCDHVTFYPANHCPIIFDFFQFSLGRVGASFGKSKMRHEGENQFYIIFGVQRAQVCRLESGKSITLASMMRAFRALGVQVALEMKGIGKVAL